MFGFFLTVLAHAFIIPKHFDTVFFFYSFSKTTESVAWNRLRDQYRPISKWGQVLFVVNKNTQRNQCSVIPEQMTVMSQFLNDSNESVLLYWINNKQHNPILKQL